MDARTWPDTMGQADCGRYQLGCIWPGLTQPLHWITEQCVSNAILEGTSRSATVAVADVLVPTRRMSGLAAESPDIVVASVQQRLAEPSALSSEVGGCMTMQPCNSPCRNDVGRTLDRSSEPAPGSLPPVLRPTDTVDVQHGGSGNRKEVPYHDDVTCENLRGNAEVTLRRFAVRLRWVHQQRTESSGGHRSHGVRFRRNRRHRWLRPSEVLPPFVQALASHPRPCSPCAGNCAHNFSDNRPVESHRSVRTRGSPQSVHSYSAAREPLQSDKGRARLSAVTWEVDAGAQGSRPAARLPIWARRTAR